MYLYFITDSVYRQRIRVSGDRSRVPHWDAGPVPTAPEKDNSKEEFKKASTELTYQHFMNKGISDFEKGGSMRILSRGYFLKALEEKPNDPEASKYIAILDEEAEEVTNSLTANTNKENKEPVVLNQGNSANLLSLHEIGELIILNDINALQAQLANGLDPNSVNEEGNSLIMFAVFVNNKEAIELFLKAGADPDVINNELTPLLGAVLSKDPETVKLLLKYNADPNLKYYPDASPHTMALAKGEYEIAEIIRNAGGMGYLE